ncbi:hypothetical protein BV25DRAFT_1806417 [Artomyces pyxidatus]|uniref:Uncharacterized protein n=1 Tax=Artomyces pyxidatus TaxID=48021 RepID=A0ACB8SWT8_9AGAM|nr:hypothetical protein BV25DRAFT_1806417 [Artomyces pyxidatus]
MCAATGLVTVAIAPDKDGGREAIVGGALWLAPGQKMDPSALTLVRISPWRTIWQWGATSLKRLFLAYTPAVEKAVADAFAKRGRDRLDSWHLMEIGVDPAYEGQGFCGLLLRDGFARASPKPIHLEATTPRSRDIYKHHGFEVDEEHWFGMGEVNAQGLPAKGEAATGWPDSIMTKVSIVFVIVLMNAMFTHGWMQWET